jgi:GNAT superfamily N-acetyltransferase
LEDARICLARSAPFIFVVPTHTGWGKASNGVISFPSPGQAFAENHCILARGYDDNKQLLLFANSWGTEWGDNGFGYLPYEYFAQFVQDAWVPEPPFVVCPVRESVGKFICADATKVNSLGNRCVIHDLWDTAEQTRFGWCFGTERDGRLDVEEFFIRPEYRGKLASRTLMSRLLEDSQKAGLPLRFWIPYCDVHAKSANVLPLDHLLTKNNFVVKKSGVPWALFKAEQGDKPTGTGGAISWESSSSPQSPPSGFMELDSGVGEICPVMK